MLGALFFDGLFGGFCLALSIIWLSTSMALVRDFVPWMEKHKDDIDLLTKFRNWGDFIVGLSRTFFAFLFFCIV